MMPLCHATGEPSALPSPFKGGAGIPVAAYGWGHNPPRLPLAGRLINPCLTGQIIRWQPRRFDY